MANVEQHKNLCLIGSILALVGAIPSGLFRLVGLAGVVLILIGLKGIGDVTGDDRPFKNYLYSFLISIISAVLVLAIFLVSIMGSSPSLSFSFSTAPNPSGSPEPLGGIHTAGSGLLGVALVTLVVMWVIGIISIYFRRKALKALYELTGTKEFESAANWLWWGALTLIILVGVVLIIVGAVYQILGFSRMPSEIGGGKDMGEGWVVSDDDFRTEF